MRRLSARLSDEACDGWERWAAEQGVTVASVLEALGLDLDLPPDVVLRAREIQRARKRRR